MPDHSNNGLVNSTNILELTQIEKNMFQMTRENFDTIIVLYLLTPMIPDTMMWARYVAFTVLYAIWVIGYNVLLTKTTPYMKGMNWVVVALFCLVPMAAWASTLITIRLYLLYTSYSNDTTESPSPKFGAFPEICFFSTSTIFSIFSLHNSMKKTV